MPHSFVDISGNMNKLLNPFLSLLEFQGPDEDADEESELSVTEMKEQREKQKLEMELRQKHAQEMKELESAQEEQEAQDRGCSWGMCEYHTINANNSRNVFHSITVPHLGLCVLCTCTGAPTSSEGPPQANKKQTMHIFKLLVIAVDNVNSTMHNS